MVIIGATASKDSQYRMVIKCAKVILSFKTLLYRINSFRQIEIVYGCVVVLSEVSLGSPWFFSHILIQFEHDLIL